MPLLRSPEAGSPPGVSDGSAARHRTVGRARRLSVSIAIALCLGTASCTRVLYNLGTVQEDRILRSGQPSPLLLRWLVHRHGVRAIVNLRGRTPGFESAFAARNGLRLFSFDLSATRPPTEADVRRFLQIASDPGNHPLLVHCRNGVDRTGYMIGIYRIRVDGWDWERAAREMNRFLQYEWLNAVPQRVVRDGARSDPR